jgi:hypothetical protein
MLKTPNVILINGQGRATSETLMESPAIYICIVEPGYNDIDSCDTSLIKSDVLWYQLIPHC